MSISPHPPACRKNTHPRTTRQRRAPSDSGRQSRPKTPATRCNCHRTAIPGPPQIRDHDQARKSSKHQSSDRLARFSGGGRWWPSWPSWSTTRQVQVWTLNECSVPRGDRGSPGSNTKNSSPNVVAGPGCRMRGWPCLGADVVTWVQTRSNNGNFHMSASGSAFEVQRRRPEKRNSAFAAGSCTMTAKARAGGQHADSLDDPRWAQTRASTSKQGTGPLDGCLD